jgi:hypothetical protein
VGIIIMSNDVLCFSASNFARNPSKMLCRVSEVWTVFDPHEYADELVRATPIRSDESGLSFLDGDEGWLSRVILFCGALDSGLIRDKLEVVNFTHRGDWSLPIRVFLVNFARVSTVSTCVYFPRMWFPDGVGENGVFVTSNPLSLLPAASECLLTPVDSAAVLQAWPEEMFKYISLRSSLGARDAALRVFGAVP